MKISEDRYKFIGSKIKEVREAAGVSQKELAEGIGLQTATAISLIESGERRVAIEDLEKIAEILHKDINYFLGREVKSVDLRYALRADDDLTKEDKDKIISFVELVKASKHGSGKK